MRFKKSIMMFIGFLCVFGLASEIWAFEIITETDIKEKIIVREDLIKTADNAIIYFDSSGSMDKPYKDTGMTRYEIAKKTLKERNNYFPDLGHNMGLYLYTPWKVIYPVQKYNREKFAQALETLPEQANTPTLLADGLARLGQILEKLKGKTAVFIYTDGEFTKMKYESRRPLTMARELAINHNVCFYFINTADDSVSQKLFNKAQSNNFCSRVIPFDEFIENPSYNSEALFTVRASRDIVTVTDEKVVGVKTNDFLFDFDKIDIAQIDTDRLTLLADYLKKNPNAYAALAGHTDSVGPEDYNLGLSFERAKSVATYLIENHRVDETQLLLFWYGELNPAADNSTADGRQKNRRVEITVGGI